MKNKIRVIECANQLGLGGTEYALQLYCKYFDKDTFDVTAVALQSGGARVGLIEALGIKVLVLNGDLDRFKQLLKDADVLHWHGAGDVDDALFKLIRENKPKIVIQTNVFGYYKKSPLYDVIDYDLFISKMIIVRRMVEDGFTYESKRKVLPYPVDIDFLNSEDIAPSNDEIIKFKAENNLTDCFVVGRIGRADDHKFDMITLAAFKEYGKFNPGSKFLLVGATANMIAYAKKIDVYHKLVMLDNTSNINTLLIYYKAMDVFLAASNIGESFGMVIAEAMSSGTPVVTISTPDRDNAQIELVDNMQTGIVVPRIKEKIALALNEISSNKTLANRLSNQSKKKIFNSYRAPNIVNSLEQLILKKLGYIDKVENTLLLDWNLKLKSEYEERCTNLYGDANFAEKAYLWLNRSAAFKALRSIIKKIKSQL